MEAPSRPPYPSDVTDDEWTSVAPYPTPVDAAAPQRRHALRELCDGLRFIGRTGMQRRFVPHDLPPWAAVSRQTRRRPAAGSFDAIVHDPREVLGGARDRAPAPTAAIRDRRTARSTPERGARAGEDGRKRTKGSKGHAAVDTLGRLPALRVTPADARDRDRVGALAAAVREATGESVEGAFVDQGDTGARPAAEAAAHGIRLEVAKLPAAKRGFVRLPRRRVVERAFAWAARFRRLARDDDLLPTTPEGFNYVASAVLALKTALPILAVL